MIERTMLKRSAHQNPSTLNPGTIELASIIIKTLIMIANNPKVTIVIGRVRIKINGFIKRLIIPRTTAVTSAAVKLSTLTPGRIYEAVRIISALTIQLISNCIKLLYMSRLLNCK
jgi:hypothetical protein